MRRFVSIFLTALVVSLMFVQPLSATVFAQTANNGITDETNANAAENVQITGDVSFNDELSKEVQETPTYSAFDEQVKTNPYFHEKQGALNEVSSNNSDKSNLLSDNLFYNAKFYNNDLATICADMCIDVDNIAPYFPAGQSAQYVAKEDSAAFHMGVGYKTIYKNGSPRSLISLSFRGTGSDYEKALDFLKDVGHWPLLGEDALNGPYHFKVYALNVLNDFISSHPAIKDHPIIYLVTGYSLGGAAANLLAAELNSINGGDSTNKVFCYTFGAIKAIASPTNTSIGYQNIHNIYNYYDSWGPHGNYMTLGVSDPNYKFGNTYLCYFTCEDSSFSLNNHDMGNYRNAVANNEVNVTIDRKAGILNDNFWWALSNNTLSIGGFGDMADGANASWNVFTNSITRVYISGGISRIGNVISDCVNADTVWIPVKVTSISDYSFNNYTKLNRIIYGGTKAQWDAINVDLEKNVGLKNATLFCHEIKPHSADNDSYWSNAVIDFGNCGDSLSYTLYGDGLLEINGSGEMTSHPWSQKCADCISRVEFPDGLSSICNNAFENCVALTDLVIPANVKEIGNFAFKNSGLTSLTLSDGIEILGFHLLYGNTGVKELTIPGTVTSMRYSTASLYSGADRGVFENCALEKVTIENGVTTIAPMMFRSCKSLTEVNIPNSVTTIEFQAFEYCSTLQSIHLPNSITKINYRAFAYTGLTELRLPANIISIGSRVLSGNIGVKYLFIPKTIADTSIYERLNDQGGLLVDSSVETVEFENGIETIPEYILNEAKSTKSVMLPSSVREIGNFAFRNSGLDSLTLPDGIEILGFHLLYGNTGVKELTIPGTVTSMRYSTASLYSGADRGVFENCALEKVTIENGVTTIAPMMFRSCKSLTEVNIPNSVTTIEFQAFEYCSTLQSIHLPNSITKINYRAFAYTGLTELRLPANIISIGSRVLSGNIGVKYLFIPKTIADTSIYERLNDQGGLLVDSSVETVEFENGIETIPEKALFRAKNTTGVILPTSVKTIGNSAFEYSGLTSLTLPEGIETIGYRVLYGNTGVKELTIPGSVRNLNYSTYSYGGGTFENSGLEKVIIKKGLTIITPQSFLCCKSLNSITIPDSVTKIGERAFCWCTSLESVDLPNSIMRIDAKAFQDSGLKELVLPAQIESIGSGILTGNTEVAYLRIPKTFTYAESRYSSSDYGMLEGSAVATVEFEEGIETIPEKALFRAKNTTEVILPTSVKTIGNSAFEYSGLTSLTLPEGIETIGYRVLYGNTGVKELTIPGSVRNLNYSTYSYGGGTFENSGLEKVIIKKGLTIITPQSFLCCKSLNSITIPDSVTKIGERAFCWCTSLESVDLPNSIMRIDAKAFQDSGLKELVLPAQIESIGSGILTGNTEVAYLRIPKTFTYAESRYSSSDYGMLEGSAVATVEFEEGIETIPEKALFRAKNTTEVILPTSVKTIGNSAFEYSGLTSLTLPEGIETIGYRVLYGNTDVKELTIPGSVKNLNYNTYYYGGGTFQNSALKKVVIEEGISTIPQTCFRYCSELEEIIIPYSVNQIGDNAFDGCTKLIIYGYSPSFAESFAEINSILFASLGEYESKVNLIGDTNLDGKITIDDATLVQKAVAELIVFDSAQQKAADVTGDGIVTIDDATMIQKYVAEMINCFG